MGSTSFATQQAQNEWEKRNRKRAQMDGEGHVGMARHQPQKPWRPDGQAECRSLYSLDYAVLTNGLVWAWSTSPSSNSSNRLSSGRHLNIVFIDNIFRRLHQVASCINSINIIVYVLSRDRQDVEALGIQSEKSAVYDKITGFIDPL